MDTLVTSGNQCLWDEIFHAFPVLNNGCQENIPLPATSEDRVLEKINDAGLSKTVIDLISLRLEHMLPHLTSPFWFNFSLCPETSLQGFCLFADSVETLYTRLSQLFPVINSLQKLSHISNVPLHYGAASAKDFYKTLVRGAIHSRIHDYDLRIVRDFYKTCLKVIFTGEVVNDDVECKGCTLSAESCRCQTIIKKFVYVKDQLQELGLLDRIAGNIVTSLIYERIESHVYNICKGNFDKTFIDSLDNWLRTYVGNSLRMIYGGTTPESLAAIKTFEQQLEHFLYQTYTKIIIDQLFNIIIEYPDSLPSLDDLKVCLGKTDMKAELTTKLQKDLVTRLLHPGVNTIDVLTAYISAIKALRFLDPTGVLLELVTEPVRQYLRNREDTVKCIINSLIDDAPSELAEELVRCGEKSPELEDLNDWENWTPDPIDADASKPSQSRKTSDVISMLVNVYGSKDLFVKEYTTLLAKRLLSSTNYDTEKEYRYLELLKLRFGESELHTCDVMLKDICDSKRINSLMDEHPEFATSAKILSATFWPVFKEETLELPDYIRTQLEIYTKAYEKQKANRTLCWKPHLGTVNLEMEIGNRTVQIATTPIRATIIWHFQNQTEWSIEELSCLIKVSPSKLRREAVFWQSLGVLKEAPTDSSRLQLVSGDSAALNTHSQRQTLAAVVGDDDSESVMASAQDQREEELSVFWSYIVGMLTNLESLPLDRIHQMLKMFASQGSSSVDCSAIELQAFLNRKVREHKLIFSGGLYRLPKL